MNTTTHLARHMLSFQPNKDAARLCLYHFLIHHCERDQPLNSELFEDFCRMALLHPHWQENSHLLSQELQFTLQHYNETFQLNWSLTDFVFPDQWQVIAIKNQTEVIRIIENWIRKVKGEQCKNRIFTTPDNNYVVLIQEDNGDVSVSHCGPLALLRGGELEPLSMAITLHYNGELELKPDSIQYLKLDSHSYARFSYQQGNISAMLIRGYIFQNKSEPTGSINQFPELFYALKRLEQYYVDRSSDSDYQELVQILEKSLELFKLGHPEAERFGQATLERGKAALENIFINDNILQSLVDQLHTKTQPTR